ncbi:Epsin-3, clathrin recruitment and traffic between the Golgi and endosome [Dissophora globulifera]|uniref:Epsin-3, clathrin recruitment and traffic between the Golgi and endosome n=1 Tax=Dissophora globulifera TaxID=979702 RepID=A0A9P6R7D9_9FUNG|nr:Epsin-3, clathrin recruitment and traffic between the Golgi and endosome [Dissophora globulifera]
MENFIENVSGYSMWDIRNALEKVTAKVMNYTEMEQKVREATSNDPWGASGTLKQELAQATHNFQSFNEIMPAIFKRFAEKEPRDWRQIYKSLVLLEYLVTHGSERVVDETRGHLSTIKYLRNFQYVDENGKDEGINVRTRAKEFAEMLSSVDRIKEERKKAKANRNKFVGSEGGGGGGGGMSGAGSKYGGFGSDSYFDNGSGGYSGGGSGSGSSYRGGSGRYDDRGSSGRSSRYDDDDRDPSTSPPVRRNPRIKEQAKAAPKPEPVKEVNLFDFDEPVAAPAGNSNAFGATASNPADDGWGTLQSATDDFDDFQSAPPVEQKVQTSAPAFPAYNPTMASVLPPVRTNSTSSNPGSGLAGFGSKPSNAGGAFDLLGSSPVNTSPMSAFGGSSIPPLSAPLAQQTSSPAKPSPSIPAFGNNNTSAPASNPNDIWANASGLISLDGLGKAKAKEAAPSMNALAANSWNSGAWASKPAAPAASNQGSMGFGNFGSMTANTQGGAKKTNNNTNFDDLLS